jgi:DNA polymerase
MQTYECHIDFETRSRVDLRKSGVYRYVEDASTGVWVLCWRVDKYPVEAWRPGDPDPVALLDHIRAGGIVKAHNSAFERMVWNYIVRRHCPHWPMLTIEQMDCTMARAAAVSHPQSLDDLCRVLDTETKKDREGHALMMQMARPRRFRVDGSIEWWDDAERVQRLTSYCGFDVLTECDVDAKLPPLTDYERAVWHLDQIINDRGICIDVAAAEKCATLVEIAKKAADREMRRLTRGAVPKCSNDNKIIEWIQSQGIECTTVKKGEQDDLKFMADLHDKQVVRDVIELRADSKKTSTAKYKAMTLCVCSDGRIRGLLNYHGAGPGRWAGRLVQPQNFPRVDHEKEGYVFEWMIDMLHDNNMSPLEIYEAMATVHGESGDSAPLRLLSRALRSMICAAPGKKLVGGDFSNIEGRVNAWNAREDWKLRAFAEYDAGTGPDLYVLAYAKSFNVSLESVGKAERQIGKVEELALGYQGGVGAFIDMGDTYGLDPYKVSAAIVQTASAQMWDATAAKYATAKDKNGLREKEWTAIKIIVDSWRTAHPGIVQSWWDLQDAAINAVANPGIAVPATRVTYYSDGRCLWCVLPSGRMICYAQPELEEEWVEYIDKYGQPQQRLKRKVTFWGVKEGQWRKLSLYGGLQCENIVQGTARCIMVDRMFEAERNGYPLVLTVHDELLAEVEASRLDLNAKHFEHIMSTLPAFAEGLPLAAKAWEEGRYVK